MPGRASAPAVSVVRGIGARPPPSLKSVCPHVNSSMTCAMRHAGFNFGVPSALDRGCNAIEPGSAR